MGTTQARGLRDAKLAHRLRDLVRPAAACSHRTFVRSAEACFDVSEMPLKLTALTGTAANLRGQLRIRGTRFERGTLELALDDTSIEATITPTGHVLAIDASPTGTVTLARTAR
jgi:hypothetical protein